MSSTLNCIVCFKEATCFGGHVHKDGETLIATFCSDHFDKHIPVIDGCKGCYGQWKEEMGEDTTFGTLYYIDGSAVRK